MVTPAARRQAAGFLQADFEVSERRACSVVELPRATCRYQSVTVEDPQLRKDLRQLAGEWPSYGYRMLHGLLKRKGLHDELGPEVVAMHHAIKQALDPAGIFNPGKVFGAVDS